jgi:hypothetical protein
MWCYSAPHVVPMHWMFEIAMRSALMLTHCTERLEESRRKAVHSTESRGKIR